MTDVLIERLREYAAFTKNVAINRDKLSPDGAEVVSGLLIEAATALHTASERIVELEKERGPVPRETPDTINAWALETFGPISGPASIAARANKEMAELITLCVEEPHSPKIGEEVADVVICLYRMSAERGFDLFAEIDRKMIKNRGRKWIIRNGHGQHVGGDDA